MKLLTAILLATLTVLPVYANSSTGEISETEVISYVKNVWGWTEFGDNAIKVALDGAYEGMPIRDCVKGLIVGAEFQNLYLDGKK